MTLDDVCLSLAGGSRGSSRRCWRQGVLGWSACRGILHACQHHPTYRTESSRARRAPTGPTLTVWSGGRRCALLGQRLLPCATARSGHFTASELPRMRAPQVPGGRAESPCTCRAVMALHLALSGESESTAAAPNRRRRVVPFSSGRWGLCELGWCVATRDEPWRSDDKPPR